MYCSISGEVPVEPVISIHGYLFEHRLISEHIARTGACPITNESLSEDQLTIVKVNQFVRPREVTATSIPALLSTFQNEWDAVMQQTFELRKQLAQVKQEYSTVLYREDAAKRVIARLLIERDEARAALSGGTVVVSSGAPQQPEAMEIEATNGLSQQQETALEQCATQLSAARKVRVISPTLNTNVAAFKASHSATYHESSSKSGIAAVCVSSTQENLLLTAGQDGIVSFATKGADRASSSVKIASKAINCATFVKGAAFAVNSGNVVTYWDVATAGGKYEKRATYSNHSSVVYGLSAHPSGDFLFSTSKDNSWALLDIASGAVVYSASPEPSQKGFLAGVIHPDGLLFGTGGADGAFRIWDVRTRANVITQRHDPGVSSLAFSESGFIAATGGLDGNVNFWDLRQLRGEPLFHTATTGSAQDLQFDKSATYLAVAAKNVNVFKLEDTVVTEIASLKGHSKKITSVAWGTDANFLASSSIDTTVKIWEPVQ